MLQIDIKSVKRVYSGNHKNNNCRCGCAGKYHYSDKFASRLYRSNLERNDYSFIPKSEISDTIIDKVVRILNANIDRVEMFADPCCYNLKLENGRTYTAFIED